MKAAIKAEQFVTDTKGKRVGVLLDLKSYQRLLEAEEELADIQAFDAALPKAKAEIKAGDFLSFTEFQAKKGRKGK